MEQLLSAADAARLLGVVPATVRQMERDGRLPAQRTAGGMRLFRRQDVERLANQRAATHISRHGGEEKGTHDVE